MKKLLYLLLVITILSASGCSGETSGENDDNTLYIYNWGEYIDPDVLTMFTEETGIDIECIIIIFSACLPTTSAGGKDSDHEKQI